VPAFAKVRSDICDSRAANDTERVVPADVAARLVRGGVEPVARIRRQVDPADERDPVVDHDELLVMAVQRALLCVVRELDLRAEGERVPDTVDVLAVGMEERQRRPGPDEHAHRHPLGELGQQRAQLDALPPAGQCEVGRDVPPGHMDVRARTLQLGGEPRQRLGAVDEHLERAAGPRRRIAGGPQLGVRWLERPLPAEAAQAAGVMAAHDALRRVADCLVEGQRKIHRHTSCPCSPSLQPR
jgi:hypothetical protein